MFLNDWMPLVMTMLIFCMVAMRIFTVCVIVSVVLNRVFMVIFTVATVILMLTYAGWTMRKI